MGYQRRVHGEIAAESPREQTLGCGSGFGAGYNPHTTGPYYTNWGLQTCCQPVGPGFESRLIPGPGGQVQQHVATHHSVETCVDDEIPCEIIESGVLPEEMVSSWTGICGVPGLGYSLRPQEGCDLETCQLAANTAQQVQDILNSEPEWSANSAQNLASLKVDLPRVNHHDLVRSRTVSVQQERSGQQPRETASKQPNSASKSHSSSHSGGSVSGYNGVSAVSHLMSDSVNFERHNPASKSSNAKRPLRATVASRLRSKVSLPASWPSDNSGHSGSDKGPNSLPTQFIPRAPIPTPEILAAARNSSNKASNSKQNIVTQQKIVKSRQCRHQLQRRLLDRVRIRTLITLVVVNLFIQFQARTSLNKILSVQIMTPFLSKSSYIKVQKNVMVIIPMLMIVA